MAISWFILILKPLDKKSFVWLFFMMVFGSLTFVTGLYLGSFNSPKVFVEAWDREILCF